MAIVLILFGMRLNNFSSHIFRVHLKSVQPMLLKIEIAFVSGVAIMTIIVKVVCISYVVSHKELSLEDVKRKDLSEY